MRHRHKILPAAAQIAYLAFAGQAAAEQPIAPITFQLSSFETVDKEAASALEGDGVFFNKRTGIAYIRAGNEVTQFTGVVSGNGKHPDREDVFNSSPIPAGDYTLVPRTKLYAGKKAWVVIGREEYHPDTGFKFGRFDFLVHVEHLGRAAKFLRQFMVFNPRNAGCVSPDRRHYGLWIEKMELLEKSVAQTLAGRSHAALPSPTPPRSAPVTGDYGAIPVNMSAYQHALFYKFDGIPFIVK